MLQTNVNYLTDRLQKRVIRVKKNGDPVFDQYVVLKRKVRIAAGETLLLPARHDAFEVSLGAAVMRALVVYR